MPEDAVALDLFVKNVPSVLVKVFEINTRSVYMSSKREIATDINLDGLVPNTLEEVKIDSPPIQRELRTFPLHQLSENRRGVWVVEFIGGGKITRALIRKGQLQLVDKVSLAGHIVQV